MADTRRLHNELADILNAWFSGILMDHELLSAVQRVAEQTAPPAPHSIDVNTGLRYPGPMHKCKNGKMLRALPARSK